MPRTVGLRGRRRPALGRAATTGNAVRLRHQARALEALEEELARQQSGLAEVRSLRVGPYLESWLTGRRRLRDTTRRHYRHYLDQFLLPSLGDYRLDELRPHHIDVLYTEFLTRGERPVSASTVRQVHTVLRAALNTAVRKRLIAWNPALHVELPEYRRGRTAVWTPGQVGSFLDATAGHRLYALFHLIAFTGLRRGEALGLHWVDVDLDAGHLVVAWQVINSPQQPSVGQPKTSAGARVVPIDAGTVEVLKRHRDQQDRECAAWAEGWTDTGMVFAREDGTVIRPDYVSHLFTDLVERSGLPRIRLHDLRHTHASLALAAGIDVKVVSARLGHSSTAITSDLYTHVIPAVARQAADAIASSVPRSQAPEQPRVSEKLARDDPEQSGRGPPHV